MKFRAAIFDLDGTLLDTLEDLADAVNMTLHNSGYPRHDVSAYRYFIGDGIETLVKRALPESCRQKASVRKHVVAVREEYAGRWANKTRPYDGIPELLSKLMNHGIDLAVCSNKPEGPARELMKLLLPEFEFKIIMGASPTVPPKPDPTGAVEIAGRLGVDKDAVFFIGDSGVDMITARLAGMYGVGAQWGFRTADELISSGAGIVVNTPFDLLPWIEG